MQTTICDLHSASKIYSTQINYGTTTLPKGLTSTSPASKE